MHRQYRAWRAASGAGNVLRSRPASLSIVIAGISMNRLLVVCAAFVAGAAIGGAGVVADPGPGRAPGGPAGIAAVPGAASSRRRSRSRRSSPEAGPRSPRSVPAERPRLGTARRRRSRRDQLRHGHHLGEGQDRQGRAARRSRRAGRVLRRPARALVRRMGYGDGPPPETDTPEELQSYLEDLALRRSMRREARRPTRRGSSRSSGSSTTAIRCRRT